MLMLNVPWLCNDEATFPLSCAMPAAVMRRGTSRDYRGQAVDGTSSPRLWSVGHLLLYRFVLGPCWGCDRVALYTKEEQISLSSRRSTCIPFIKSANYCHLSKIL